MLGLRLRHLIAVGRGKEPARIDFDPGLNVVYGAANTGKTHILQLIDFALGSSSPPEAPPEQLGYEGVMLGIQALDGRAWTLCRSLKGGDIRRLDGLQSVWPSDGVGDVLGATHRVANSLSKFLLEIVGMSGVRLRRNAKGDLQDLSFRNLAHLVLIPEGKIQSETSPVETGQYISKTAEFSLFKYMLSGVDDSSLQISGRPSSDRVKIAAKLELLDSQIAESEQAVKSVAEDRDELDERHQNLEQNVETALRVWDEASGDYRSLSSRRRSLRTRRDGLADREDEIDLLVARFALLDQHYESDLGRLKAIEEAASIFAALDEGPCPWCGADIAHRGEHATALCSGDIEAIRSAAAAEQGKINTKKFELADTVAQLSDEKQDIESDLPELDEQLRNLDAEIRVELPDIQVARAQIAQIISQRDTNQVSLAKFESLERLRKLRSEIVGDESVDSVALIAEGGVDTTVLDEFSQAIERFLTSWLFPGQRVFFDLPRRDIQVSGKARRINGKGVRAVLHSAFSLGLLQFTADKDRPHPRLLMLDSPLVTYRDPIAPEDVELSRSNLVERFYEPFRNWDERLQVIIIENRDPPLWVAEFAKIERFTGTKSFGRAGFYL
jgi:hypothetical protein